MNHGVTVVIPTIRGREEMLMRALESVDRQIRPPEDVIVWVDELREGAAQARNRALEKVHTEYVAWLDDDDSLMPNHIDVCLRTLEETGADLVYPGMMAIGGRDPLACPVNNVLVNPFCVPFRQEQADHLMRVGNFIPITWVGRVGLIRAVGAFPEPWADETKGSGRVEEDYGLLMNMLRAGAIFVHAPYRTWKYHFHDSNSGGRGTNTI